MMDGKASIGLSNVQSLCSGGGELIEKGCVKDGQEDSEAWVLERCFLGLKYRYSYVWE